MSVYKDHFGKEIEEGDYVLHIARCSSSVWIEKRVVRFIDNKGVWTAADFKEKPHLCYATHNLIAVDAL